jgi:ABC-type lipoprotein export system ATPase subunit
MESVSKVFPSGRGRVTALRSVDLRVEAGEFLAITGPSGSGKTTLLNLAGLLDRPTAGRVLFRGRDVSAMDERGLSELRKRSIGRVFQNFCLLSRRSVMENVLFRFRYLDVPRAEAAARAREAVARVGLDARADQPVRLLSGGEMQRAAIARALAIFPDLLLVDEPTGNLDAESTRGVMSHFRALHEQGSTIVLVSHNPLVRGYCSRTLACVNGVITDAAAGS